MTIMLRGKTVYSFITYLLCFFLVFVYFLSTKTVAQAQSFLQETQNVRLVPTPEFPKPFSKVEISLNDYSIDTLGSTINWYLNGELLAESTNERSITVETGKLGQTIKIGVTLTNPRSPAITSTLELTPVTIDLILESDTYIPPFYNGRSLPSRDSMVRAIAVVQDGKETPDTSYTYKWTLNNEVIGGGALTGKNTIKFAVPHYNDGNLTVSVFDRNSVQVGRRSFTLNSTNPEIHFYENSPLRGLSGKEISSALALTKDETAIFAEPYFMNVTDLNQNNVDIKWKINGTQVESGNVTNTITLGRSGEAGDATVACTIVTKEKLFQFAQGSFQAFFQ